MTDLHSFYEEPAIIPLVEVDDGAPGVPSDQSVFVRPLKHTSQKKTMNTVKHVHPIPESALVEFGNTIMNESWDFLKGDMSSTELVYKFQSKTALMVESSFLLRQVSTSALDKPWITEDLKIL